MSDSFVLQHPGTCTGMFWREDPRPNVEKKPQKGNKEWPRNGSVLKGTVHSVGSEKWLEATEWKQANTTAWIKDCQGLWMVFDQGGPVLHNPDSVPRKKPCTIL